MSAVCSFVAWDGQTDGLMDGQNYDSQDRASIASSRGKNDWLISIVSITGLTHDDFYDTRGLEYIA